MYSTLKELVHLNEGCPDVYVTFACSDDTLIETCACELDHSLHELHLFFEINVLSKYSHKSRKSYFFNASFILVK